MLQLIPMDLVGPVALHDIGSGRRTVAWREAMKALVRVSLATALVFGFCAEPVLADGFKNCTKLAKASWKPAAEAEAKAKEAGYEVRRSKVEGSCYEVYGVKGGKLFELFYSPEDLSLKHTIAK